MYVAILFDKRIFVQSRLQAVINCKYLQCASCLFFCKKNTNNNIPETNDALSKGLDKLLYLKSEGQRNHHRLSINVHLRSDNFQMLFGVFNFFQKNERKHVA